MDRETRRYLKINTDKRKKIRLMLMHVEDYLRKLDDIDFETDFRNNLKKEIQECMEIINNKDNI